MPKRGKTNQINWGKSIGHKVNFIYDDIKGIIEIIDCHRDNDKRYYLKIKYDNNNFKIKRDMFINCNLGNILGICTHNYKYQIDDIIENIHSGKLQILKQIKIKSGKYTKKGYKYRCLKCSNEDIITESNLTKGQGCNVCCHNHIKRTEDNNLIATNSKLAKLLLNSKDGYKYTEFSSKKVDWICPNCGNIIKNKKISHVNMHGLSCEKCSDGISYPNKIMSNLLYQLNIDFKNEKTFDWSKNRIYDFYLSKHKIIVECNGLQHYQGGFERMKSNKYTRNLEEEQENDKNKKELAIKNGINKENYIVIDCRKSELEWIKNQILNSRLNELFNLTNIDWIKCHEYACNSLVKKACNLWNEGTHSTKRIQQMLNLSRPTVTKYLKRGKELELCDYDASNALINSRFKKRSNSIKVICLNNKKIFNSISKAGKYYNLKSVYTIGACCKRKRKSAGKDPITREKLKWMYYDDYLKNMDIQKKSSC